MALWQMLQHKETAVWDYGRIKPLFWAAIEYDYRRKSVGELDQIGNLMDVFKLVVMSKNGLITTENKH